MRTGTAGTGRAGVQKPQLKSCIRHKWGILVTSQPLASVSSRCVATGFTGQKTSLDTSKSLRGSFWASSCQFPLRNPAHHCRSGRKTGRPRWDLSLGAA